MSDPSSAPLCSPLPLAAWLPQLAALELTAIHVDARLPRPIRFSDPVCAVARGLLGERLRDLRCLTRAPTCEGCADAAACDYARIFAGEAGAPGVATDPRGVVHPYWLQGLPALADLPAEARLAVRLVVVGAAAEALPYLDVALRDALANLGVPASGERLSLSASRLERITIRPAPSESRLWRIEVKTPLVLRGDLDAAARDCPAAPWLALLVRAGVRRLHGLLRAFGAPPSAPAEIPDVRDAVVTEGQVARWRGSRFSQRQGVRFPLDGLVGSAVVRGEAMPAVGALLQALQVTSVGKTTTMGFGVLEARPLA